MVDEKRDAVWDHIDRCIEIYSGQAGDIELSAPVERASLEMMRSDLMLAIGMLAALHPRKSEAST